MMCMDGASRVGDAAEAVADVAVGGDLVGRLMIHSFDPMENVWH
jgi:hypothetical protein